MKKMLVLFFALVMVSMVSIISSASAEDQYSGNLIPVMTSATTPSGIVTSSTEYSGTPAWKAFDGNKLYYDGSTYRAWGTNSSTGWIAYEFPTAKIISKYVIYYGTQNANGYVNAINPKNWTFEGTIDGNNWVVLDTQTNITSWITGQEKAFTFINNTPYKRYRINISEKNGTSNGTVNLTVHEIAMMEKINTVPDATTLSVVAGNAQITLTWPAVTGATGYNIKRSTTAGGPYTTVATNVYGSPYTDTTVTNGTTYYYVVTAVNTGGESTNSNEASATPTAPAATNRALLVITLVSGLEKEYDLSMTEVNSFTTWYAARAAGTGAEVYTINKSFNKASFLTRKDNIAFNKIELYEVNEYTPAP
ncbi:discoidin domain-containing protein [Paenibacillus periandrae]|uniref:discoidin domain-containing protein n=1 Tax=Paenibacillus periandrae TaxID=1761741 RepID=UPI001F09B0A9|nr:discoidin domain-containing protein [Paenibacillus periandrae]